MPERRPPTRLPGRGRLCTLAAALALVVGPIGLTSARAAGPAALTGRPAGSIGVRLLDRGADPAANPQSSLYIVDHLAPGTTTRRRVAVSNTSATAVQVVLYAAAAAITDGSFLGAAGHTANDVSSWTSVSPAVADVPGHGTVTALVTVTIPKGASPGERYAVMWAEARSVTSSTSASIVQVNRVGVREYISVGPGGAPAAAFRLGQLSTGRSAQGRPTLSGSVVNTGGRALNLTGVLTLDAGPAGLSAGPFTAQLGASLPVGGTEAVTVALDAQLPAGPWEAHLSVSSGPLRHTATGQVTFPPAASVPAARAGSSHLALTAGVLLAVLLAAAGAVLVYRRRGRRRAAGDQEDLPAEAPA